MDILHLYPVMVHLVPYLTYRDVKLLAQYSAEVCAVITLLNNRCRVKLQNHPMINELDLLELVYFLNGYKHWEINSIEVDKNRISLRFNYVLFEYYDNGNKRSVHWFINNSSSKLYGPATVHWFRNGDKRSEIWYKDGKLHRTDGPSWSRWYENGNKHYEYWHKDGRSHRVEGPSMISWYENGYPRSEYWYVNGLYIREWTSTKYNI